MTSKIYEIILFVFTFTNIFFIIGQDWYCLLNHCLSTQRRPHARPRAMPRAVFSFTNNNPFHYKQSSAVKTIAAKIKQWLRASTYCYGARSRSPTLLLSITGKKIVLNKGVYMDKELNSLIGTELKSQMLDSRNDIQRTNKLVNGTKITISLSELDNSDNLEDEKPSNTLFTYYVTSPEC